MNARERESYMERVLSSDVSHTKPVEVLHHATVTSEPKIKVFASMILYQGSRTVSNFHLQQSSNKGINVGGIEVTILNFPDDMTTFVRDKQSYITIFNVINLFGTHTGLKINHDKTECLLCGNVKENACSLELDVCEF